jgi:small conductance mechanosensitive channel
VTAAGVTGTIREIGLFGTVINTPDNIWTIVGNNKVLSDTIQNFSTNPHRRVELVAQLHHVADHQRAIAMLKDRLAQIPNVLREPAPEVEILQFTPAGPLLAVRPYTHNVNYWQVYFDTNRLIREAFGEAGFPIPEQHVFMRSGA